MQRRTLEIGGEQLHFADFGDASGPVSGLKSSGKTVVLVHGLGGSHVNWFSLAPMLVASAAGSERRVVAVDLPGFGLSRRPAAGSNLGVMQSRLEGFIQAISDQPVDLIGNSMGGLLSILTAGARADLVRTVTLLCPALPVPLRGRKNPQFLALLLLAALPGGHLLSARRMRKARPEAIVREMMKLTAAHPERVSEKVITAAVELASSRAERPWMDLAFSEATRSILKTLLDGRKVYSALGQIRVPCLLIQGEKDRLVDVGSAREAASRCPNVRLEVLPDVGHVPQLEAAEQVLELVAPLLADRSSDEGVRAGAVAAE